MHVLSAEMKAAGVGKMRMGRIGLGVLAVALSVSFLSCGATNHETPPNIILIISDDQGWTDYGFMGHPVIRTPHLDRLAGEGVVFRHGYVPTALCRPSLMTLVTGRYAHTHGITGNDPSPRDMEWESPAFKAKQTALLSYIERFETLPKLLAERGYLSHQSGKWWEGSFRHGGFSHGMTEGSLEQRRRHGDAGLVIGRETLQPIKDFLDLAVGADKPFFLWYAPLLPHGPHTPPSRLLDRYRAVDRPLPVARYDAMCEWFDETVGELVGYLESKGLRERTLIVYVADNGWIQDPEANGFAPRSKQTPYEGGVRTPIFFSWPGRLPPADRPELASSIDLFPTILAAAGARIPSGVPGINLLPYLEGKKAIERTTLFGETFAHDIADIADPEASLLFRWCIDGKWKLILTYDGEVNRYALANPRSDRRPQLFDLEADPNEQVNRAGDEPEVVARLAAQIDAWYPVRKRATLTRFE